MKLNLAEMSREEKLRIMQVIWEDLAQDEQRLESPAWHGEALSETEERARRGKETVRDWEDAKEELRRRAR